MAKVCLASTRSSARPAQQHRCPGWELGGSAVGCGQVDGELEGVEAGAAVFGGAIGDA